jgi:hypothetical protein
MSFDGTDPCAGGETDGESETMRRAIVNADASVPHYIIMCQEPHQSFRVSVGGGEVNCST